MLLRFFKIFLWIVFTFVVFFLVFFTFFISENSSKLDYLNLLEKDQSGIFNLSLSWTSVVESKEDTGSWVYIQKLNNIDAIYYTEENSSAIIEDSKDTLRVKLDKWIFILDFNDLTKTYTISAEWFNLEPIWWGKIYVDTLSSPNLVFSLNSTFNLEFKDITKQEVITSIYLFPHSYIKFYPEKNLWLANTDLYRIKTKVSNGYFWYKLTNTDKINALLHDKWAWFFDLVSKYFFKNDLENITKYNMINSFESYTYPWKEYIDKYFSIFVNKSKKRFYYKNIIYNDIVELFDSKWLDDSKIDKIVTDLDKLKELDHNDYNEIVSLVKWIYSVVVKYNNIEDSENLYNFINLVNKIDWENKEVSLLNKKFNYLKNVYLYYDFKWESLNPHFKIFIEKLFSELEENNEKIVFTSEVNKRFMESFLFYMEDYIENNLYLHTDVLEKSLNKKENLGDDNYILHKYLLLNNTIYFSNDRLYEVIKTWLLRNKNILLLISDYILNNLLEEAEKSENKIFVVKDRVESINQKDIENLKSDISFILKLYKNNSSVLDYNKDKLIITIYNLFESKFYEYFLALLDYSQYSLEFDINEKGLIDYIIDNEVVTEKTYTKQDVKAYLSNFSWVKIWSELIEETEDKNIFAVENLSVNNKKLSFDIDFENLKTIKNIYINWQVSYNTYLLDDLELTLKELYYIAPLEEKERYNFKNFFSQMVSKNNDWPIQDLIDDWGDEFRESKTISAFKMNILSSEWELGKLKWILNIKYNNLEVKWTEDITIKDSVLYTKIDVARNTKSYISHLSSKYFLDKEGSYLYDDEWIKLTVYTDNWYNNKNPLFGWNKFKIIWRIKIWDLKDTFENISFSFDNVNNIYSHLLSFSQVPSLDINYILETNTIIIKLENNWKVISITLLWDNVISLLDWNVEYIQTPIRYNSVSDILKQVK